MTRPVASGHPALRAIVPRMTSADLCNIRIGTRWDTGITPLYAAEYFAHHWVGNDDYDFAPDWSVRPLANVFDEPFGQIGQRSVGFDAMVRQTPTFTPFPYGHPFDGVEVPTLHSVGWFDNIGPDSMRDFMTLRARGRSLQYLVAASTDHENYALADAPIQSVDDHDTGDDALQRLLPRYLGPALDFFDAFLGTTDRPALSPVRWHLGHGGWRSDDNWPPVASHPRDLYLDNAARSTVDADGGVLTDLLPRSVGHARWSHDPADLVPSTVQNPFALLYEHPDERDVQGRDDVATFTTAPVSTPLDLAGPVELRLALTCTDASTHVYAKLCDVAPDGRTHMLTRGQTFVPHADRENLVSVYLGHTGYRLRQGHCLRLHLASSDFPLYLPHLACGASVCSGRRRGSLTFFWQLPESADEQ